MVFFNVPQINFYEFRIQTLQQTRMKTCFLLVVLVVLQVMEAGAEVSWIVVFGQI